jgi:hypothetical protein
MMRLELRFPAASAGKLDSPVHHQSADGGGKAVEVVGESTLVVGQPPSCSELYYFSVYVPICATTIQ